MEALLTGSSQFIVTSVNFLITSSQAIYVNRLEEMTEARIKETKTRGEKFEKLGRFRCNWRLLLSGWWVLTGCSLALVFGRIIPSAWLDSSHPYLIGADIFLVSVMGIGYGLLASVAFRAWKFGKVGQETF